MATRKPLVLASGEHQQAQAGDVLQADSPVSTWKQFTISGAAATIDWSQSSHWYGTLASGANALSYSNTPAAGLKQQLTLRLQQPASGAAGTVTWATGSKHVGGTAPALSTANNAVDYVTVVIDPTATRYETFLAGANLS